MILDEPFWRNFCYRLECSIQQFNLGGNKDDSAHYTDWNFYVILGHIRRLAPGTEHFCFQKLIHYRLMKKYENTDNGEHEVEGRYIFRGHIDF